MSLRKLMPMMVLVALVSGDALAATPVGTWEYRDARVSMSVLLKPDGTCRVIANVERGMNMNAPCTYAIHNDVVIIDWKSLLPVRPYRVPSTTRLYFRATEDALEMEGESRRWLTRWGVEKG